jgi:hypothetical protein
MFAKLTKTLLFVGCCSVVFFASAQKINRQALVHRHDVQVTKWDSLSSLTVGNGNFAFTVDITGLQSFPIQYKNGITLGTESEWGWHSFMNKEALQRDSSLKTYELDGKKVSYMVQRNEPGLHKQASDWFRQNPHRLQLGNVGFKFIKKDGSIATIDDIQNTHQQLDLWRGEIHSSFIIEQEKVEVITFCDPKNDQIFVRVVSELIKQGRLQIQIQFPYPSGAWSDEGALYNQVDKHASSIVATTSNDATLQHVLDTTRYFVKVHSNTTIDSKTLQPHQFIITPQSNHNVWECAVSFQTKNTTYPSIEFNQVQITNQNAWKQFWNTTGVIDFSGSKDTRAFELERRVILSQYLMHVQESGILPPQETGLVNNSWFGKPHLEMTWWHMAHNGLWNQPQVLENLLHWYASVSGKAKSIASRQGYKGARWQKMTDPEGEEVPSSVGAFLIWQQPHPIYFAEQLYRLHPDAKTLEQYKSLVFMTADFMSSFVSLVSDTAPKKYKLSGVIPAQERFKPEETFNPTYELVYWKWALQVAEKWRQRLHLPINQEWHDAMYYLSDLPIKDDKYLFAESATASYTDPKLKTDHPSVLAALGVMPMTGQVNRRVMTNTFNWIWDHWDWKDTWGWDFPMTAMTATRLGMPHKAIDALLMPIKTNTYLVNGHNYQDQRLRLYLPGNGGLLTAMAMMVAGYDGANTSLPGIPKDGKWKVRFEGIKRMP